jgi:hypothetical protein
VSVDGKADLRRFGRRSSSVNAFVLLPGNVKLPCIIENVSDGGALLRFTDGAAPTQSFRLMLEDTSFNLLCEVRHQGSRRLGVRFVRLAEGIALNHHLQREMVVPDTAGALPGKDRRSAAPVRSIRALRLALLGPAAVQVPVSQSAADAVAEPVCVAQIADVAVSAVQAA